MTPFENLKATMQTFQQRTPRPDRQPDPSNLEVIRETTDYVRALVDTLRTKEQAALENQRLSDLGRQEAIREIAQGGLSELGPLRRKTEVTNEALDRVTALALDYMTLPDGVDKLEALLLAQEVRAEFRGQSQAERDGAFIQAAGRLDRVTMRAFQAAPAGPWISGEVLRRGERSYAERKNSSAYSQLQRLTQLRDHLLTLSQFMAGALLRYGVEPRALEHAIGFTLAELNIAEPPKPLAFARREAGRG